MNKAREVLFESFGAQEWILEKPKDGMQKECYIARSADRAVFIKFSVSPLPLLRLGEIAVAPKVLSTGLYKDEPFVIQELIAGSYPERSWIESHLKTVAKLITTYHQDKVLTELLSRSQTRDYRKHIDDDLKEIEEQLIAIDAPSELRNLFAQFKEKAAAFENVPLVPVHNEPNTKNMLLSGDALRFIDWDEIVLSDPLRDAGPFLWWYVPDASWREFLRLCNIELTEQTAAKIYWFAARASLVVYLWRTQHGYGAGGFFDDFVAALAMQPNPRFEHA